MGQRGKSVARLRPRPPFADLGAATTLTFTLLLYAATLFLGAALLFVVQPMVGKMILPFLGGTPAVWSTCMVFFQAALLAGYAHASSSWLAFRRQAVVHAALLVLGLGVALPLDLDPRLFGSGAAHPVLDVLRVLSVSVGMPFLAVSATAPAMSSLSPRPDATPGPGVNRRRRALDA